MSRLLAKEHIDSQYVFNMIQCYSDRYLIIDVRDQSDFNSMHLARSINIPYRSRFSDSPNINELKANVIGDASLFDRRRRFMIFIVYSPPSIVFSREVDYILKKDKCREVYILNEPFSSFAEKFPFMCEAVNIPSVMPRHGYPSEIISNKLYLGDFHHAEEPLVLQNLKITHILNATNGFDYKFESRGVVYLRLGVEDLETENISRHFQMAFEFIDHVMSSDKFRVLVHCAQGVSRSATFVIMYIMKSMGVSYEEAFSFVKRHREIIKPNEGFACQLRSFADVTEEAGCMIVKNCQKDVTID
ncbi:unnamed protein product [Blepharisma stoltei]|uniref:protein-tyrosine-phosphatase n=1 Tax=Blepharisma stoltei TaxID=1481888 RepID=A0AAU9KE68_9CILI|nr:unnamed protein product [Blepharisma stoltei]